MKCVDEGQVATASPVSSTYDLVFDNDFYCAYNPAPGRYINDASYGLSHFMNKGIASGLRANMVFDLGYYKSRYPDLRAAFGDANSKYCEHYAACGASEGRQASAEFDPNYYKSLYPDLRAAFGSDNRAYVYHFLRCGMKEGRSGCRELASFNIANYRNHYADLQAAYEDKTSAYYAHYLQYGRGEGRTSDDPSIVGTSVLAKVDYSPVYDYAYYISNNPDVLRAFGGDPVATIRHFLNNGMAEGRQGCQGFEVASYYNANADLRAAFGTDLCALAMHYVTNGKGEGRICEGVPSLGGYLNYLQGVSYSPVYDGAYYYARYSDLRAAFLVRTPAAGTLYDDRALLRHFVDYGMPEGRQASEGFDVYSYRARYPDLRAAFGSNLKSYYTHYLTNGQYEGRSAA